MYTESGDTKKITGCNNWKVVTNEEGNYLDRVGVLRTPIN